MRTLLATLVAVSVAAAVPRAARANAGCLDIRSAKDSAYVIATGNGLSSCGDMSALTEAAEKSGEKSIWFRLDAQTWVVRDPATVAEGLALFEEVHELGAQQGALGAKQGFLGAEQGALAAKQAAGPDPAVAEKQAALGKEQAALGQKQRAIGEQMSRAVAKAQSELSRLLERAMNDGTAVRAQPL